MSDPAPYPRVPHLLAGRGATSDDRVLRAGEAARFLERPVLVEEKLDGANVMLWLRDGAVRTSLRAGTGAIDRGGQLGPLNAWAGPRSDELRTLLADGMVLYAEWLYWTHSVAYDRLPSYLVGLDLRSAEGAVLEPDERTDRLSRAGITAPPALVRGVVGNLRNLDALMTISRFGEQPMEGTIIRALDGEEQRIAKHLSRRFIRLDDHE